MASPRAVAQRPGRWRSDADVGVRLRQSSGLIECDLRPTRSPRYSASHGAASLPDSTKRGLELKGYDAEGFWKRLRNLNVREIVSIVGDDGETIEIWVE